jgi:CRISPR-associated exonuclease Cas4
LYDHEKTNTVKTLLLLKAHWRNMQYIANKFVSVSNIASYYLCPRMVFFRNSRDGEGPAGAEVRAGLFKAVSYALSSFSQASIPEGALETVIDTARSDTLCVYGQALEPEVGKAALELKAKEADIAAGLQRERVRLGDKAFSGVLLPSFAGLTIYSDKLRISGILDKVVNIGDSFAPLIISTASQPRNGVYASERVKLAAYALLLSEKYGVECDHGYVEYVSGWCLRKAAVRYEDKRKALYARNRILEAMEGRMPEASRGKWCERCSYASVCSVRVSVLDRLLKK